MQIIKILLLGKGQTKGLNNTSLTAEKEYYIFQDQKYNFV